MPSILSHVSIGTNNLGQATAFYESVLETLGIHIIAQEDDCAVAFGREQPEFWVVIPEDDAPATIGNGSHFGFAADSREAVNAFHSAALASGGSDAGPPGLRPQYGDDYYGCFVHDPDGHKIEAVYVAAGMDA